LLGICFLKIGWGKFTAKDAKSAKSKKKSAANQSEQRESLLIFDSDYSSNSRLFVFSITQLITQLPNPDY